MCEDVAKLLIEVREPRASRFYRLRLGVEPYFDSASEQLARRPPAQALPLEFPPAQVLALEFLQMPVLALDFLQVPVLALDFPQVPVLALEFPPALVLVQEFLPAQALALECPRARVGWSRSLLRKSGLSHRRMSGKDRGKRQL